VDTKHASFKHSIPCTHMGCISIISCACAFMHLVLRVVCCMLFVVCCVGVLYLLHDAASAHMGSYGQAEEGAREGWGQ
jgi:hypothetical protein